MTCALFDELSVGLGMRCVPCREEEIELHADVVVPDRGRPGHLDGVRADLLDDVLAFSEEGEEPLQVG